jgi:hypothetical protein
MSLIYDDLFGFSDGLCHLRVYAIDEDHAIALAVNLEDNPGPSVVNAAELLQGRIAPAFARQFRLFSIFPEFGPDWTEVISPGDDGRATHRTEVTQSEVEQLVGVPVEVPAATTCGAADLGGDDHPLLALIPDEVDEPGVLAEMEVVAVADLPWAHLPSKCANFSNFEAIRPLYDEGRDGEAPTGAHFFLALDQDQLDACPCHRHDWKAIAAAAVQLFARVDPEADHDEIRLEASRLLPEGPGRDELAFLFFDPIIWSPEAASVTNGQHRTCALKAADAPECPIVTRRRLPADPSPGDPRRRAESTIAEYWARRLGRERT